ncbi:unnamed protein product [Gordionus sp. m RMFG-2023]
MVVRSCQNPDRRGCGTKDECATYADRQNICRTGAPVGRVIEEPTVAIGKIMNEQSRDDSREEIRPMHTVLPPVTRLRTPEVRGTSGPDTIIPMAVVEPYMGETIMILRWMEEIAGL